MGPVMRPIAAQPERFASLDFRAFLLQPMDGPNREKNTQLAIAYCKAHPKWRLSLRGRSVSRRCFVATPTKLILPAYGALTGGLDAGHPEIVRAVGSAAEALVPVEDRLLRFPLAA